MLSKFVYSIVDDDARFARVVLGLGAAMGIAMVSMIVLLVSM